MSGKAINCFKHNPENVIVRSGSHVFKIAHLLEEV